MQILGISCYYHDAAAALVEDGKILACAEEERFTRKKHDNSFPINAINYCLREAEITPDELNFVVFHEKPIIKFDRILQTSVETFPYGYISFWKMIPSWLNEKLRIKSTIKKRVNYKGKVLFVDHHTSHAASVFFCSPFRKSAILTIDGVGEWKTVGLHYGIENTIFPIKEIRFPTSLGLLYSTITAFLGFRVNNDEYKVMGLASYGGPKYYDKFRKIIEVKDDGSFELNMDYFDYRTKSRMWNKNLEDLLGTPRKPEEKIKKRHADIAHALQTVTEDVYFKIVNHLYQLTRMPNLCLAGGLALNCVANGKLYDKTPFKKIFVQPAAGDSGCALGAALFVHHQLFKNSKRSSQINVPYSGPSFSNEYLKEFLERERIDYEFLPDKELIDRTAKSLAENKVVGWFQGRMEWGPRALGNRSILANPKNRWMKDRVNEIKRREKFRPFAGSILQELVHTYFEVPEKYHNSPFMVFAFKVKDKKRKFIQAITHVDNTCRIQTVNKSQNHRYYNLIKEFYEATGIPVILNTSFNLKGGPIVCKPEEAYRDFISTTMDALILENFIIEK